MADIAELGFVVDTDELKDGDKALDRLEKQTKKTEKATDKLNDEFERGGKSANRFERAVSGATKGLSSFAAGMAGGLFGGLIAGGIEGAISSAFNGLMAVADQVEHMSNVAAAAGGTIGGVQVLTIAMNAAGVETGELERAAKSLNRTLGDIALGSGPGAKLAAQALDRLGLSASALSQLDIDERFTAIGNALNKLGLSASENAAILDNLGIKSTNLIAALSGGGEIIADVSAQMEKLGVTLTEVDQKNLADLDAAFDELGITGTAAGSKIAAVFAPFVTGTIIELNKFLATTAKEFKAIYDIGVAINNLGNDLGFGTIKQVNVGEDDFITQFNAAHKLKAVEAELAQLAANRKNSLNGQIDAMDSLAVAATGVAPTLDNILLTTDMFGDTVTGAVPSIESLASGFEAVNIAATAAGGTSGSIPKVSATLTELNRIAQETFEKMNKVREEIAGEVGGAFKSFFKDIMHGASAVDALNNSLGNLADRLMDMVLDQAINGLLGGIMGGAFGGLGNDIGPGATWGGMQSFLNGAPAFAGGGDTGNGARSGGIDGMGGFPAILHPQETVIDRYANDNGGAAANDNLRINLNVSIVNNASNDVGVSVSQNDDGSLEVQVDRLVAKNLADPKSQTNKAMSRSFGVRNATVQR